MGNHNESHNNDGLAAVVDYFPIDYPSHLVVVNGVVSYTLFGRRLQRLFLHANPLRYLRDEAVAILQLTQMVLLLVVVFRFGFLGSLLND